ncbi:hydantoinase B/oxoprolinase family protein [Streptomyces sp. M10(2022)]
MRPGDVYAINDPYHGGTHLPDVTVVTPVFDEPGEGGAGTETGCGSWSPRAAITPRSAVSPRLHARLQPHDPRGGRAVRQLAAGA